MFTFIHAFSGNERERRKMPRMCRDEVLLAALMAPMAYTNLAAPLRTTISITDLSEETDGATESANFLRTLDPIAASRIVANNSMNINVSK